MVKKYWILIILLFFGVIFYWNLPENKSVPEISTTKVDLNKSVSQTESTKTTIETVSSTIGLDSQKSTNFRAITVDDLLKPEDRTKLSTNYINNHNNLLSVYQYIKAIRSGQISIDNISTKLLIEWTQILINDVYFLNAVYQNLLIAIDIRDIEKLDLSILPDELSFTTRLDVNYLKTVTKLANDVNLLNINTDISTQHKEILYRKIANLLTHTKKQSNVFYTTKMKHYYKNNNYSLEDKIRFARAFLLAKDDKQINTAIQYFQYAIGLPEYTGQEKQIRTFLSELSGGKL